MDKPLVSIVIPTKNWAKYLARCLAAIKKQSYDNIEIIVDDNNSVDETKQIAERYGARVLNYDGERCAQRNHGASQAQGKYLLILDGDMELSADVVKNCVDAMTAKADLKGLIIPEESFGQGFWSQCKKMERSYYVGLDWMEAARFFERQAFESVGGYNSELIGGDDYDLSQRIAEKFGQGAIGRINDLIYHNERQLSLLHSCRKKFFYGQTIGDYQQVPANKNNFRSQASVVARYKLFFSRPSNFFKNPLIYAGMIFMKTCEFGFGGAGYLFEKLKKI